MIVAVVGSREGINLDAVQNFVEAFAVKHPQSTLISGGARGVDACAELTAFKAGLSVVSLRPVEVERDRLYVIERWLCAPNGSLWEDTTVDYGEWPSFRDAAFARNIHVVKEAQVVVAFTSGSHGTAHAISEARRMGRPFHVYDAQGARL